MESQTAEWKESWRDDHLRWICGFANAEGGVLHIGLNNEGKATGLNDTQKLLEDLPNKIRDILGIVVDVNLRKIDGIPVLEIAVPPYPSPISYRGRYYQRVGSTNQELKGVALDRFLLRKLGRTWDGAPLPGISLTDLDATAIRRFRELAKSSGRLNDTMLSEPDDILLRKLKLTESTYLKRAAILLFHEDPEQYVTGAFVKIGFFRSDAELMYHDLVQGDLFTQVRQTLDLLLSKYLKAAITYEGIQRIERYPVPREALRETILNAIVHRDYQTSAPVQIRVYENGLKIWNPAVLPEGWTLDDLLTSHASHPYNPDIANAFFRAGEIEAWGQGIQRIFDACRNSGTPKPSLRHKGVDLWTEFQFSEEYLAAVGKSGDGLGSEKRLGETLGEKLGEKRAAIVRSMIARPSISGADLARELGISVTAVENHLKVLRQAGYIRRIGPAKGGRWEVQVDPQSENTASRRKG